AQEQIVFNGNWGRPGIQVVSRSATELEIIYSVPFIEISELVIDRETLKKVSLPGALLGNNEGAPDLPGIGRFIAFPQGAKVAVETLNTRTHVLNEIDLAPAPNIPAENDDRPLIYARNPAIFGLDVPYPAEPVMHSGPRKLRGVDVFVLGITPFAYNPVQKQLTIYTDLRIRVTFEGGNGRFGDDRYRSRWFEPLLRQHLLNYDALPSIDFGARSVPKDSEECEYMIFVPDNPAFLEAAQTIKSFRVKQGITTNIFNIASLGGTSTDIENKINDAYLNWSHIKPVAALMLGDVPDMPANTWSSYCLSDNIYADVDGDDLPEINIARMTGRTGAELDLLINKFINYETDPPTNPSFYDEPVIAGGWQTERWFVLCTEICLGYLTNVLAKNPVREYAIYSGTPDTWSTNQNTQMLLDYFGPAGLGYIPATPAHLTDWGGNATRINADINSGAFYMLHRDHGYESGWGEPNYSTGDLPGLSNDDLCFVLSINCLTGRYDYSPESFAEAFHRMSGGALGLVAASEVSYSFVNDTFIFGLHDSMWPDFDPGYGGSTGENMLMPGFAQASGKFYLEASNWPYNTGDKTVTYHLFHLHGDAFTQLYSEVPQSLTVSHGDSIYTTATTFEVTADEGSLIALSRGGVVLGTAEGTGGPTTINIQPPTDTGIMNITVTKPNHYRYESSAAILVGGPLAMWLPDGAPSSRLPGPADVINVKILNGDEHYIPGSGLLYYRMDSADPYGTVALTDLGGSQFEGVLPGCGPHDQPEFYFTAQGDLGSTIYVPAGAPATVYSMSMDPIIELMMTDDFETENGWTVVNQSVSTGAWERGDPVGTGAQPENDHSSDGTKCFVTGRLGGSDGDYDVDGGPTRLISPVIDLSNDGEISFYLYFHHTDYGTQQPLEIDITGNGSAWIRMDDVTHNGSWQLKRYTVSDHITPTATVQVRISVKDNPNDDVVEALVDDFKVMRENYDATFWADAYTISVASRSVVGLSLEAGPVNGNRIYLILGSLTGSQPGYTLPSGKTIPINWDAMTDFIMTALNSPFFVDFLSTLDAGGSSHATMDTYGPLDAVFIGVPFNLAYTVGGFGFVSNSLVIDFVP
ncbi:MAG: hypothetical protein KJ645_13360, partial [Planctomycetes bacterium]|nr:hypothetical protein [Planctomycetota bacterium]